MRLDGRSQYISTGATQPVNRYFTGLVDEVAIYPTQLSAARVQAHHEAATA